MMKPPRLFYAAEAVASDGLDDAPPPTGPDTSGDNDNPFVRAMKTDIDAPPVSEPRQEPVKQEPVKAEPKLKAADLFKKKPAEAKTDEPPPSEVDAIKAPDNLTEPNKVGWEALRQKAKSYEARVRELEGKTPELETKAQAAAKLEQELADLRAKHQEMSVLVERANIEAHPDFRAKYIDGRAALVKEAQDYLRDTGAEPGDIEAALALKGKARIDALRDVADALPGYLQGMLGQTIKQLDSLDAEAGAKREKSGEYWKEIQAQQQQREIAQRESFAKESSLAFEKALHRVKAENPFLQKVEGDDAWSSTADAIVKEARSFYETNDSLEVAAENAVLAKSAKPMLEMITRQIEDGEAKDKKIAELESELKKLHGGGPRISASATSPDKAPKGFMERLQAETGMRE